MAGDITTKEDAFDVPGAGAVPKAGTVGNTNGISSKIGDGDRSLRGCVGIVLVIGSGSDSGDGVYEGDFDREECDGECDGEYDREGEFGAYRYGDMGGEEEECRCIESEVDRAALNFASSCIITSFALCSAAAASALES